MERERRGVRMFVVKGVVGAVNGAEAVKGDARVLNGVSWTRLAGVEIDCRDGDGDGGRADGGSEGEATRSMPPTHTSDEECIGGGEDCICSRLEFISESTWLGLQQDGQEGGGTDCRIICEMLQGENVGNV